MCWGGVLGVSVITEIITQINYYHAMNLFCAFAV